MANGPKVITLSEDDEKAQSLHRSGWMPVVAWKKWNHSDPVMRDVAMSTEEALRENERLGIKR